MFFSLTFRFFAFYEFFVDSGGGKSGFVRSALFRSPFSNSNPPDLHALRRTNLLVAGEGGERLGLGKEGKGRGERGGEKHASQSSHQLRRCLNDPTLPGTPFKVS